MIPPPLKCPLIRMRCDVTPPAMAAKFHYRSFTHAANTINEWPVPGDVLGGMNARDEGAERRSKQDFAHLSPRLSG
jgi:hypothetical protein